MRPGDLPREASGAVVRQIPRWMGGWMDLISQGSPDETSSTYLCIYYMQVIREDSVRMRSLAVVDGFAPNDLTDQAKEWSNMTQNMIMSTLNRTNCCLQLELQG
jgi:hypothetical protein